MGHHAIVGSTAMNMLDTLPPLDSRALSFDVDRETRRTVVDLVRGDRPTTILGVLLAHSDGLTMAEIADLLEKPIGIVGWQVEKLEHEDLCVRVAEDRLTKVLAFAAYTEHNE